MVADTNVDRRTRDLFRARRFARQVSPLTTVVYTHPSDEEMSSRLRRSLLLKRCSAGGRDTHLVVSLPCPRTSRIRRSVSALKLTAD